MRSDRLRLLDIVVYSTARDHAPALKPQLKAMLASLPADPTAP